MNPLDLAYAVGAALLSPVWARKARGGWAERFGRNIALPPTAPGRPRLLIHAVSVGEVNTLRALVPMLRAHAEVVVATTTDTGLVRATELFASRDGAPGSGGVVRYPLDFSGAVERFLDAVRPDAVALVELEVWPHFVASCARRRVPVAVINGRLSAKSFANYRRVRRVLAPTFGRLALAAVQDEAYAERFVAMGVAPQRVVVTDTMKWDAADMDVRVPGADDLARALGIDRGRPLVVAGSTAGGEEALVHGALAGRPDVQLLCAPRKPERFDEAAGAMPGVVRRSARRGGALGAPSPTGRYLLDTIGELRAAYALCDVAVIGRSFVPLRGSDPIEPIALGKPALMGPDYRNFESTVRALAGSGALMMTTRETLARDLGALLDDAVRRARMGEAGVACVRAHQGATRRHADLLLGLVRRSG